MSLLSIKDLSVNFYDRVVLDNVSIDVGSGECIGLLGANGAGKTTFLRAALGLMPHHGISSLSMMKPSEKAKQVAWMPQSRNVAWPVSVENLVMLGRIPHIASWHKPTAEDEAKIASVMTMMNLNDIKARPVTNLSGGEQARVLIARVLAQDTPLIMADEPVAGLDPAQQILTMQVFLDIARSGRSVIVSLHDIGIAARYCTRIIMLSEHKILADGSPVDVLTHDNLARVFNIRAFYQETEYGTVFQPLGVIYERSKDIS